MLRTLKHHTMTYVGFYNKTFSREGNHKICSNMEQMDFAAPLSNFDFLFRPCVFHTKNDGVDSIFRSTSVFKLWSFEVGNVFSLNAWPPSYISYCNVLS